MTPTSIAPDVFRFSVVDFAILRDRVVPLNATVSRLGDSYCTTIDVAALNSNSTNATNTFYLIARYDDFELQRTFLSSSERAVCIVMLIAYILLFLIGMRSLCAVRADRKRLRSADPSSCDAAELLVA